jgi:hypothetical protein
MPTAIFHLDTACARAIIGAVKTPIPAAMSAVTDEESETVSIAVLPPTSEQKPAAWLMVRATICAGIDDA